MTVLSVTKEKKHLARLTLEDGRTVDLDQSAVKESGLRAGMELSEEELSRLSASSDFVRAKERALWYLDRGDLTERGLQEKLKRAGFSPETAGKVLGFLREYGMVNDARFAERFAELCAERHLSKRATYAKMVQKGVPRDLVEQVLDERPVNEEEQIRIWLAKKYAKTMTDPASVQKVYAALMRKGFSYSAVRSVMKAYAEELEYSEE